MSDGRPQLLFFCSFPPPHTGQSIATHMFHEIICADTGVVRLEIDQGGSFRRRPGTLTLRRVISVLRDRRRLVNALREERPDILYVVVSSSALGHLRDLVWLASARPLVRRIVAHVHCGNLHDRLGSPWNRRLSRAVVERIDRFLFTSEWLSQLAADVIPSDKRRVVPNTVDSEVRFSSSEVEAKIEGRRDRQGLEVLFLSNMIPSKGFGYLAEGVARVHAEGVAIRVRFVGAWPEPGLRRAFERTLTSLGVAEIATVHGAVSDRRRIKEMLKSADVVVLPTEYPVEAQPLCLLEAMNAGTPIVATDHASIREFLRDGHNGYVIQGDHVASVATALRRLVELDTWEPMARAARATYLERFNPTVVREKLLQAVLS